VVARAIGTYGLLYASIFTAIGISGVPRTVGIIQPILLPCVCRGIACIDRIREIMSTWHPDTVYHAAAYKHVSPRGTTRQGIKNNVLGTLRAAQAAIKNGVADFVLISTDKAVRPTNSMDASKRLAEMVLQAAPPTL
jgi:FlaA1/EpsC-like NDP-sugar epimerase